MGRDSARLRNGINERGGRCEAVTLREKHTPPKKLTEKRHLSATL
jgi:hypothetical protein